MFLFSSLTLLVDMELELSCLLADRDVTPYSISSPFKRDVTFLFDEDSGLGMEMVRFLKLLFST